MNLDQILASSLTTRVGRECNEDLRWLFSLDWFHMAFTGKRNHNLVIPTIQINEFGKYFYHSIVQH